jgi:hypothetical protein
MPHLPQVISLKMAAAESNLPAVTAKKNLVGRRRSTDATGPLRNRDPQGADIQPNVSRPAD